MTTRTRWNHLSDLELLGYQHLIQPMSDQSIVDELFIRLATKITERKELDEYRAGKKPSTPDGYLL